MQYKDYYKILGLQRDANLKDIKHAYQKLAHKYHPDVSKLAHAEEKFKEVNEAYKTLKNPTKRAAFDKLEDQLEAEWQERQKAKTTVSPPMHERPRAPPIAWLLGILCIVYFFSGILQPVVGSFIAILFMIYMIHEL